jgi:hypothetical protein
MKAGELAKILLEHPENEVRYVTFDAKQEMYRHFSISKDYDIGYADKLTMLSGDEVYPHRRG